MRLLHPAITGGLPELRRGIVRLVRSERAGDHLHLHHCQADVGVGFEEDLPYVVVAVAIEEQPSLLITTNLVGDFDPDQLDIGLPVVATFSPRGDIDLLQFRLDGSNSVR